MASWAVKFPVMPRPLIEAGAFERYRQRLLHGGRARLAGVALQIAARL